MFVMLSLSKHLYRTANGPFNEAVEMLRLRYAALGMTNVDFINSFIYSPTILP